MNDEVVTARKFGRYEIKSELGRGGMATVYLAHDPRFGRDVALKVMSYALRDDPTFRSRFVREARTIATLEHPAIVPVYDFGEDHDQPYLVMRYMTGGSLADRIVMKPFTLAEAVPIIRRIGAALDHAHRQGVVHRDLKPGNILFDQYGNSFLSDFGIVKLAEATSSMTGSGVIGTPAYMSPEQIHGDTELDGRSDIYTLGIILFEMLTGRKPYRGDTPVKQMMAHILNPIPNIREMKPELPPGCEEVIHRVLAKQREERFNTASEMTAALSQIAGSSTIPAPRKQPGVVARPVADPSATDAPTETLGTASISLPSPDPLTVAASDAGIPDGKRGATRVMPTFPSGASPPSASAHDQIATRTARWRWLGVSIAALVLFILLGLIVPPLISTLSQVTPTPDEVLVAAPEATATTEPVTRTPEPTTTTTPTVRVTAVTQTPPQSPTPGPTPAPETIRIGFSVQGTPLEAVRFGQGPKSVILIGGLHTGFAPGSVALAEAMVEHFSQNMQEIPYDISLFIITTANPDSPRAPGQVEGRLNGNGVDLNRNWDCRWRSDANWNDVPVNGGEEPFSEPEVQALRTLIEEQEAVAVVFWEARAVRGLVSPGSCDTRPAVSEPLARTYGQGAGYPVQDYERLVSLELNGDSTNWLDQAGFPAITVFLPDYTVTDFDNNLAGVQAVLNSLQDQ